MISAAARAWKLRAINDAVRGAVGRRGSGTGHQIVAAVGAHIDAESARQR